MVLMVVTVTTPTNYRMNVSQQVSSIVLYMYICTQIAYKLLIFFAVFCAVVPQDQQTIADQLKEKLVEASLNRPPMRTKKVKVSVVLDDNVIYITCLHVLSFTPFIPCTYLVS